ncbi:MAG TPA: DUF3108 domain-containing protein [Pyrinomonadaceae bacterium]
MNLSLNLRVIPSFVILLLALAFPVFGQNGNGGAPFPFSSAPYQVGEHLTYDVSFSNFLSVAHVEVQVMSRGMFAGRDSIQLQAHAQTTGVVNVALFSLNNDYTTYIDPETGLPFHSQEVIRDATRSNEVSVDMNPPAGTDAIPSKLKSFPGTYDFLSAFYRVRSLPLAIGSVYTLTIHGDAQDYQAEFKVTGKEVVKTNVGSFSSVVVQVRVNGGAMFKNAKAYFSDDERHVPVLITARVSTGDITVELAGSEIIKGGPTATPSPTPPITVVATPTPTPAPRPSPTPITTANADWPFSIGEQLNYQVYVGNTNAPLGLATFQVKSRSRYFEQDGLYLSLTAQTTGAAARLFVANDTIESYVDPQSFLPYRTVINRSEGRNRINQTLIIDQNRGAVTTDKGLRLEIPIGTHDYLSLFYTIRSFIITPPKRNAIPLLVEGKTKTLFVTALKRETIEIGQQKIKAIAISLTTDDPQSDKYQLRAWISDDRRRLPLRFTCQTELGQLRADLAIVPTSTQ